MIINYYLTEFVYNHKNDPPSAPLALSPVKPTQRIVVEECR
jgi:hypothetical protein